MRLGFICERSNNSYYRAIIPMRALEQRGHTVIWPSRIDDDLPLRELLTCDLVHCYRRLDRIEALRELSRRSVALSFDNDDNYATAQVSEVGPGLKGHQHNRGIFKHLIEASKIADITTTPSPALADVYRAAGVERVNVIENHLERSMAGFGSRSRHDGTVIGWVAGREHSVDLDRLPIVDALRELLKTRDEVKVISVGMRLPLNSERYKHMAEVPFPRLLSVTSSIDIGIAPLADIAFNRTRSNVKLKEYSSGGAAWVASPVGPYAELGEREGGVLAGDDAWLETLDGLIRETRRRRRLAKRALKWAKGETIDHHVELWERAFEAVVA
jgi:hypothetical protein